MLPSARRRLSRCLAQTRLAVGRAHNHIVLAAYLHLRAGAQTGAEQGKGDEHKTLRGGKVFSEPSVHMFLQVGRRTRVFAIRAGVSVRATALGFFDMAFATRVGVSVFLKV